MPQAFIDDKTSRLNATFKELCQREWGERFVSWQVVGRWTRLYSEVQLIELRTSAATRRVVAKRSVRRAGNDAYFARGDVAEQEFRALRAAEEALVNAPQYGVPRAYAVVPAAGWLLMEYVSGAELDRQISLARWFTRQAKQLAAEGYFEQLGEWLKTYQRATTVHLDEETLHLTFEQCRWRLSELEKWSSDVSSGFLLQVIARLQDLLRRVDGPLEASACHGDFGPWNVLVARDRLTVIDFFCQRSDSIWIDPLNVVTYLQTQQPSVTLSRSRVERLSHAFLRGYGRRLEVERPEFRLCLAFQQICRLQDATQEIGRSLADRYRRRHVIRELLRDLAGEGRVPSTAMVKI